jgi:site-specific recombinase XerC
MLPGFIIIAKKTVGHFFRFAVRSTDECRMFFRWLARQNHILSNPASELELSRREKRLPQARLDHQRSRSNHQSIQAQTNLSVCVIAPSWRPSIQPGCDG